MDILLLLPILAFTTSLFLLSLHLIIDTLKTRLFLTSSKLPPGSLGWPLIGETSDFFQSLTEGKPENFVRKRMEKYQTNVFKTSLLGNSYVVFCETAGHKLLLSNENKLVNVCFPDSVKKLFNSCLINLVGDDAKRIRKMLLTFFGPDTIRSSIERIDSATQQHISTYWEGKEEVKVHPTVGLYTFELSCLLFASIKEREWITNFAAQFRVFHKGTISFPINIPGTSFYNSKKAANEIRKALKSIIRQRKLEVETKSMPSTRDLLAHLLANPDPNGRFLTETEIADNLLLLLFAGHDTSKSVLTVVMKYLAEMPQVYAKVLQEHLDIAKSKEAGELLQWEDVQKMKYSWSVVSEVMRLSPPGTGLFREAIVDFTYQGYTIPKGWKVYIASVAAHRDPANYPNPENFDASRFEGKGPTPYSYIPFGGGPRMCLGNEFARLEILIFLHNIVRRFKWEMVTPDEKFGYGPMLGPSQGFLVRLQPHNKASLERA